MMARILVVDDDEIMRTLLRKFLESDGHQVDEALDGEQAVRCYRENSFDIVITDIFMPEQDGFELIMELKMSFPKIKIIAISGGGQKLDKRLALRVTKMLGTVQQLEKPFTQEQILEAVHRLL